MQFNIHIESAKYLGNMITGDMNGLQSDILIKRAIYIGRNSELLQEFYFAHPELLCKINKIYNSSFPGSVLWDFTSRNFNMLINSWSVSVRYMWGLPLQTHKFFIEPLGGTHAKSMIYSRFVQFMQSIRKGKKSAPYYLLEKIKDDTNTITGKNIKTIFGNENIDIFETHMPTFKKTLKFSKIENNDIWKVNAIREITDIKKGSKEVIFSDGEKLEYEALEKMSHYIATV